MAGPTAFRRVAGDIQEFAFPVTTGTFLGGLGRGERIIARVASPISHVALRTDIPGEFAGSGKAAQGTFHFLFLGRHQSHLAFDILATQDNYYS
jgi:hypothetical protein